MSGWTHKCSNGLKLVVEHGDMSGYVRVLEPEDGLELARIPGSDICKLVSEYVRQCRYSIAETEISEMKPSELLGIRSTDMPSRPLERRESK